MVRPDGRRWASLQPPPLGSPFSTSPAVRVAQVYIETQVGDPNRAVGDPNPGGRSYR